MSKKSLKILKILATMFGLLGGIVISFKSIYIGHGFVLLFISSILWVTITAKMREREMLFFNAFFGLINANGILQWLMGFNVFGIIQSIFI